MRTNIILMLALLVFLVGFFSSQISLTGNYGREMYKTSLSQAELDALGSLTIDDCRNIARFSAYGSQSSGFAKVEDADPNPIILNTNQYQMNFYTAFDINHDGKVNFQDSNLCYNSVQEIGEFSRSPDGRSRPATAQSECTGGREVCRYGRLYVCARDAYGIPSYAKSLQQPNEGQKCRGDRIVSYFVGKQPRSISYLFSAPSP